MRIISIFVTLFTTQLLEISASNSPKSPHKKIPEIYSYQEEKVVERKEGDFDEFTDSRLNIRITDIPPSPRSILVHNDDRIENYLETAISDGEFLHWDELPRSEYPSSKPADMIGQFTTVNVPLFYGNDAEKYGIVKERWKRSFFAIYLRKYHFGPLDSSKPVKHVILVAGGPGEAGKSWMGKLNRLAGQYGRKNLIFYVADHRGIYRSRDVVELITKENEKGHVRTSWRRNRRTESETERDWIHRVDEFEEAVGYPLVSMTCSNAARDLALISLVIHRHLTRSNARIYLHAQSYGTQVSTRTLNLLPNFYDAVLLEGLATMELVKESAKAEFGILSSCAQDLKCSQMFSVAPTQARDLLPMTSPFDVKQLLAGMAKKPHNRVCRDIFLNSMRTFVYSETISIWDAIHLSFYELLADDFVNPYTGKQGNFYPGMLVPFLIRDMYYCQNPERFSRQVTTFIEAIATSVRGLNNPYVKKAKSKPTDPTQISSVFVQTYINLHEAFDMQKMSMASERGYCDVPNQPDLVNQCPIWREQVRKLEILKRLSGSKSAGKVKLSIAGGRQQETLAKFEGKYKSSSEESDDESNSSSSDDEVLAESDKLEPGGLYKTIKLFDFTDDHNKRHKHKKHKKHRSHKKKDKKKKSEDIFKGIKWSKSQKSFEPEDVNLSKSPKIKQKKGKSRGHKDTIPVHFKRYYYDLDELAYQVPSSEKTKIFVTVGSLDVKTPVLESRRLLAQMQAPFKIFYELSNVAHSTEHCRAEIVRAMTAEEEDVGVALSLADECVRDLSSTRRLDWELKEVKGINREDWII